MFTKLLIEESGQSLVEYGLILGFVAIVAVALLMGVQMPLGSFFTRVNSEITRIISNN